MTKKITLMRSLGEFFGHVYRAVRSDPGHRRVVLDKRVREEQRGNVTLRRTTIEEIEVGSDVPTSPESTRR